MLHNNELDTLTQKCFRFKRILGRSRVLLPCQVSSLMLVLPLLVLLFPKISLGVIKLIIPHPVQMSACNYDTIAIVTDICVFLIILNPSKEI
ncbi:hypothetical protein [Nostoc sp. DedQUE12b]|uniref:hypothetical protein n=1 Tax=Nostoc sp. DedQUE12b TaxID=3075398 RepID=UPI002AD55028|nr:hypothetical protein [Nostoc sp. DedQUE12b]